MADTDQLLRLTEDLMRFRSTADRPDDLRACCDFVADFFADSGLTVERFEHAGVPSIIVTKGTKTPKIFLCGHLDVVPGDEEQFIPRRDGDKLYGRGSLDMKSGDAVMMLLTKDLAATKHDVGLMLTGDEEQGGFNGVGALLPQGYGCTVAVIPDGGKAVHRIVEKAKGILHVELQADGTASHSSAPWNGKNAISKLVRAVQAVETLFVPLAAHPNDHWVTTCNVGMISGGTAVNQIPAAATAVCDIRYTEHDDPQDILTRIAAILPEGVRAQERSNEPQCLVAPDHLMLQIFSDCIREYGRTPVSGLDHGATDGRFFSARGIPVIISQPDGDNHHAKNEWVSIPAIGLYYDVVRKFIERVA
jgi:succinyl-diaminopimelate desuccinylase